MNGRPLGVQFKRNSAYVAQEDCFVPTMSAMETLNFTATLTLPKSVSVQERTDRIEEVLRIMGLYRSRDTQVTLRYSAPFHLHPTTSLSSTLYSICLGVTSSNQGSKCFTAFACQPQSDTCGPSACSHKTQASPPIASDYGTCGACDAAAVMRGAGAQQGIPHEILEPQNSGG